MPFSKFYYSTELPDLTGFSLSQTFRLEHLGVHPLSACGHERGRFWLRPEIDEFVAQLAKPGMRAWLLSLLAPTPPDPQPPARDGLPAPSPEA
jgi:hypothetical protein